MSIAALQESEFANLGDKLLLSILIRVRRDSHRAIAATCRKFQLLVCGRLFIAARIQCLSQDTLPSPLAIGSLSQYYYSHCSTSDVYGTPVSTTIHTVVTIVFSNTVRAERSEGRHRMTPIGVLLTGPGMLQPPMDPYDPPGPMTKPHKRS